MRRSRAALLLLAVLLAGAAGGLRVLSWFHDEGLAIEPGGLKEHLMVPAPLAPAALAPLGRVEGWRYSAADGPKPTITVARLRTRGAPDAALQAAAAHFERQAFVRADALSWQRGRLQLQIRAADAACTADCLLEIAWLEPAG